MADTSPAASIELIPNRMQLIIPPDNERPTKIRKPSRKALSKRGTGVLKVFLDLPLDVIFEVVSYLKPTDILHLARLSNDFRALFMSRSSLSIWRRILQQVPGLPECPVDLTEPQYASLIYDKFCMACGTNRGIITTDFRLRIRMCTSCMKRNTVTGADVAAQWAELPEVVFAMFPSSDPLIQYPDSDRISVLNNSNGTYFRPDIEIMLYLFRALVQDGRITRDRMVEIGIDQTVIASRIMKEGLLLEAWRCKEEADCASKADVIASQRRQRIIQEMEALGWDPIWFPVKLYKDGGNYEAWQKYLNQPKEFSLRGWNMIRPKLEAIYLSSKRRLQELTLLCAIKSTYLSRRESLPIQRRRTTPGWKDLVLDPRLENFLVATCENIWTEEDDVTPFVNSLLNDTNVFMAVVRADVQYEFRKFLTDDLSEAAIFDRGFNKDEARMLFLCRHQCMCELGLVRIVDIVEHRATRHPDIGWDAGYYKPTINKHIYEAAGDVLDALGLERSCEYEEVAKLGKFICGCRHNLYMGPLTYENLVYHVYHEQEWYRTALTNLRESSDHANALLKNSHGTDVLAALIRRAMPEDEGDDGGEDEEVPMLECTQSDVPPYQACSWCYRLTYRDNAGRCGNIARETAEYHMRVKHGKERTEKDIQSATILERRYRRP